MTAAPLTHHAVAYGAAGWAVHPLRQKDKTPASAHGSKDATTDGEQIQRWWGAMPFANIGIGTGDGFFVVDLDGAAAALWAEANDLPSTLTAKTARGKHLYFAIPPGVIVRNSTSDVADGVDVRGIGGYVVAPPSIHPSGAVYQWLDLDQDAPSRELMALAPEWLLALVAAPTATTAANPSQRFTLPPTIRKKKQHETLWKYACSLWARGKSKEEVFQAVLTASKTCEEVPPEKNVRKIVDYTTGRYPPGRSKKPATTTTTTARSPFEADDDDGSAKTKESPNDLAERILRDHRVINVAGVLYEYGLNAWRVIRDEYICGLLKDADGRSHTTQKRRREGLDYIRVSRYRHEQRWRLLETHEIPVGNGVLDIRTERYVLRPHRAEDYLLACPPIPYNPAGQCPVWMRCLDDWFGGDDDGDAKIEALQEFAGYCLMSHARYKKALLLHGESDTGKSVVPFVFREFVGAANCAAVSVEDMDDPRKRAPLRGKLLNALTELPTNALIADGGFKTLVSTEEPILFDEKYLPAIVDVPIGKHVIATNHLPRINDRSNATFNRLLLIRFNRIIPKGEQDVALHDKLRGELEGVLLWALEGAQRLWTNKGQFTVVGQAELAEYRRRANPITAFLSERAEDIDPGDTGGVFLHDVREQYCAWSGEKVTSERVASMLRGAGYSIGETRERHGRFRGVRVIGLRWV